MSHKDDSSSLGPLFVAQKWQMEVFGLQIHIDGTSKKKIKKKIKSGGKMKFFFYDSCCLFFFLSLWFLEAERQINNIYIYNDNVFAVRDVTCKNTIKGYF